MSHRIVHMETIRGDQTEYRLTIREYLNDYSWRIEYDDNSAGNSQPTFRLALDDAYGWVEYRERWIANQPPIEPESRRCVNCGGYEDASIDPEGCTCAGEFRAPWSAPLTIHTCDCGVSNLRRADGTNVEPVNPCACEDSCREFAGIEWFHTQRGSIGICPVAERPGVWAWLTDRGGALGLGESGVSGNKAYARTDAYVALVRATS